VIIIPAIDLKDGKCVRLLQGRKESVTVYSDNPASVAGQWAGLGAELIHVVDLDGAFTGLQKNYEAIHAIRRAVDIPIQVGGGIRDIARIQKLMELGINRAILGTSAAKRPELVREACGLFPGCIVVGIDASDGKVAVQGWEEVTELNALEFAGEMEKLGISGIIYTDISRDGMLTGPNIKAMSRMTSHVQVPVIASGGVSRIDDIQDLLQIQSLWGVITGKALYEGKLDLKEAIEITR
jgi:phosphoribosylformimino-5-aminoimidazole carboxamide ribotide isomerase